MAFKITEEMINQIGQTINEETYSLEIEENRAFYGTRTQGRYAEGVIVFFTNEGMVIAKHSLFDTENIEEIHVYQYSDIQGVKFRKGLGYYVKFRTKDGDLYRITVARRNNKHLPNNTEKYMEWKGLMESHVLSKDLKDRSMKLGDWLKLIGMFILAIVIFVLVLALTENTWIGLGAGIAVFFGLAMLEGYLSQKSIEKKEKKFIEEYNQIMQQYEALYKPFADGSGDYLDPHDAQQFYTQLINMQHKAQDPTMIANYQFMLARLILFSGNYAEAIQRLDAVEYGTNKDIRQQIIAEKEYMMMAKEKLPILQVGEE